jgi:hypothetical protein
MILSWMVGSLRSENSPLLSKGMRVPSAVPILSLELTLCLMTNLSIFGKKLERLLSLVLGKHSQ